MADEGIPRHTATVRVTHWITTLCFFALLVSGVEIVISHPRFYWGEDGNTLTPALFQIPIPSSRDLFPSGYGYVLPDQNGWSRALHFQSAWLAVLTGLVYFAVGVFTRHFRKNLLPDADSREGNEWSYNSLQRLTYLGVVFLLFPLMIWTGLAMSPSIASAFPLAVSILGGQQSARTIHFFATIVLVLFLLIHVMKVYLAGFRTRMRAMITGRVNTPKEYA